MNLEVIKGNATPLTKEQRELVEIFVEHLRHLPEWVEKHSWESRPYEPVLLLLTQHFRRLYPHLPLKRTDELPDHDCNRFNRLMKCAGSAWVGDPRVRRKHELLKLALGKRKLLSALNDYQTDRSRLNLPPDRAIEKEIQAEAQ